MNVVHSSYFPFLVAPQV